MKITEALLHLCNFQVVEGQYQLTISKDFRSLFKLLPLDIIIPNTRSLTVSFPSQDENYHPFPTDLPKIFGNN